VKSVSHFKWALPLIDFNAKDSAEVLELAKRFVEEIKN
jgi:hypothetical protein